MVETIAYKGWNTCYRLANDSIELIVTGEVGPRVIHFGFVDSAAEANEFYQDEATLGQTGGDAWHIYGGHRLWHAPEVQPRTYVPDNAPIKMEDHKDFVRFIQPVETLTGIQKEIDITLAPDKAQVTLVHRLRNTNVWTVKLAPWALSVMAEGGRAIIPLPPRGSHTENLLPTNILTLWAYTDMQDPRWTWGTKYVMLRQEPGNVKPQKIGFWVSDGWVAYARAGHLFVKTFEPVPGASYVDFGCNVETFTNDVILEIETLGPLDYVAPGAIVEHVEQWHLFKDVPVPKTDADVDAHIGPNVNKALSSFSDLCK